MAKLRASDLRDPGAQKEISRLGKEASESLCLPEFRPPCFFRFWERAVKAGDGVFFVAFQDKELVGILSALFWQDDFSGQLFGSESHWFVSPKLPTLTAGVRLFSAFQEEARTRKCHKIFATAGNARLSRFYRGREFKVQSVRYQKEM